MKNGQTGAKECENTAVKRFTELFHCAPTDIFSAPGRVNIIGEHIDYCGGNVMPAALSLRCDLYCAPNNTNTITVAATTLDDVVTLDIDKLGDYKSLKFGNYQAGVAHILSESVELKGCFLLYDCHVPFGSGLSSSAAIEVATAAALFYYGGKTVSAREIALLCQRAEREYVGVNCGIMDQYASACGKKDCLMLLDCDKAEHEYLPFNVDPYALVICNCNKPHSLVAGQYNQRRSETEAAAKILGKSWRDVTTADLESKRNELGDGLYRRARHIVTEIQRVDKSCAALKDGNIAELGTLLNESHFSLCEDYEVTGYELDTLSELERSHAACVGARMTGGGFGGCTVALVEKSALADFKAFVTPRYKEATGYQPLFYDAFPDDGITHKTLK